MMRKYFFTAVISVFFLLNGGMLKAYNPPDEGMWLPMFVERLNYVDMQKMGLKLTAEELYSINHSSLKDAIVDFGGFCTAEVISSEGLLLTNHHCGYEAIQKHSTVENDYLTHGFWAYNKSEEIPNEGLTASFLVRMDDVTAKVLSGVKAGATETERKAAIRKEIEKLKKEASEKDRYEVEIKNFFNGNEYYMFVYEVYEDVRLVGAPPSAIGKFGGDTDNWMWPRHTGDFSMFRVYMSKDGKPAKFSKDNIPYKPKHFLPISAKGVKKNDYAMIWGYPGSTDRYMTSWGVQQTLDQTNPAIINVGNTMLPAMKEFMDADNAVNIKYASAYAQLANVWKNKIGESRGLKRLKVYDKKKALEDQLALWIAADAGRKEKYGTVLQDLADANKLISEGKASQMMWFFQGGVMSCKTLLMPLQINMSGMQVLLEKKDTKESDFATFKAIADATFKDTYAPAEQKLLATFLKIFVKDMPAELQPDAIKEINTKYKGDFDKFAKEAFETSIFASQQAFDKFIKKPSLKKYKKDQILAVTMGLYNTFIQLNTKQKDASEKLGRATRLFVAAVREMQPEKKFYPDANSTMRMTYGQVLDYYPADAVHYDYVTHLYGVMEKEDPKNDEFVVPAKLKELFQKKDFGQWADEKGDIPVCFLTTNDITGGNSGSPVINGEGQLIGAAFDGNWEAMSGDVAFEPELQRTIVCDIRYILFIIDKYANAQNLIKEMTIVR